MVEWCIANLFSINIMFDVELLEEFEFDDVAVGLPCDFLSIKIEICIKNCHRFLNRILTDWPFLPTFVFTNTTYQFLYSNCVILSSTQEPLSQKPTNEAYLVQL